MKIESTGKKKKKGLIVGIIIGVLVLIAATVACVLLLFPKSVEVAKVEKGSISQNVSEVGNIAADDTITVYAPVSGKISEVEGMKSGYVSSDEILVKFELQSFEESVKQAELNKKYAQDGFDAAVKKNNEYIQMMNTAKAEEEANRNAYKDLADRRDQLVAKQENNNRDITYSLQSLDANLTSLTTQLQTAQARLEALDPTDEEAVKKVKAEVEDLEKKIKENRAVAAGFNVSALTADEYKLYLAIVREMDFVDHYWSQNFERFLAAKQAVLPQAAIDQYADSVLMAEIEEMRALRNLEIAKRGVPTGVGGTIIERLVDAGAMVEAGEPLFVIQPDRGYKATVMISKYDIGLIEEGQKATIAFAGETYESTVESIAAVAEPDASGKPKVKVTVVFSDKNFKPIIGLEAEVSILIGSKDDALVVDSKGIYTDDEGDYAYVLKNGQVERKNIKAGLKGNGKVEILSGLKEGEEVITSPITEEEIGTRKSAK
ncbi:MAG: HlyD family efflux transporter periplasmic adaptor subunit [Lachnospiraceae bacterium]|nr:HlyD family efflux transporter periplasmic adaptor subunit [Lachnospiraceae bacterium]